MSLNLIYDRHPLKRLKTSEASEKSNNLQQNDIQYYCILLNLINMDRLKLGICFFGFYWTCSIIIVSKIRAKLRFLRCINTIFLVFLCKAIWNRTDKISYRAKHRHIQGMKQHTEYSKVPILLNMIIVGRLLYHFLEKLDTKIVSIVVSLFV